MLRRTLAAEPGLDVVGVAKDGESAVEMAAKLDPCTVIIDIELQGEKDGIDPALKIKEMRLDTGIVILSMHKDRRYVSSLPLSETHGWAYLLKLNVSDMASVLRRSRAVWTAWWFWTLRLSRAYNRNKTPQLPG